ncbi:MAG: polysaccharide deacetylase family protein, partial [Oscillospiraceae bacterium]|nr:polysaccharide deacetylase family protein [Oscillospiraceae bacterium]
MYLLYPWGKATLIVCVAAAVLLLAGAIFFPPAAAASATDPFPDLYAGERPDYLPDEGKVVYYTFDDGPSQNTVAILDTLREKGVKATFFVTAQQTDDVDSASVLRRIVQEGHSIGVHTYTHDYREIYADVESY